MDYQSNSKKQRELENGEPKPEKVVEKVIVGEVVVRKRPIGRRLKDIFIAGQFKDAVQFVITDRALPALRDILWDAVSEGSKRLIYGERRHFPNRSQPGYGPRITYSTPPSRGIPYGGSPMRPVIETMPRPRRNSMEVILESREEAEIVLERLTDIIDQYDIASVADLNELIGRPLTPIDNKWGWSVLNNVVIRQIRDGYLLDLPQADPL